MTSPAIGRCGQATGTVVASARGLGFDYGDFCAVEGVDFEVRSGEIFALLGTNGAGKTTALEIVQGQRPATRGSVEVFGRDPIRHGREVRSRTGSMLQEAGFISELTVRETLDLWQAMVSREDTAGRVLDQVELTHRADVAVEQLSGGERRRLDVGLAIWGDPELVILDEPTTGLDPASRRRLWEIVRSAKVRGAAVILTTHYLDEVEELADHLAIMHKGRIAIAGELADVLASRPAHITATSDARSVRTITDQLRGAEISSDGTVFTLRTDDLQRDLTTTLRIAEREHIRLDRLRGTEASLEDVFHAVRTDDQS